MTTRAFSADVQAVLDQFLSASRTQGTRPIEVDGNVIQVPYPYPSPADWRDCWIYFLMVDRFNNPASPPVFDWNKKYGFRQGGTFEGVRQQLPYLQELGVNAIWLSPVVKNTRPEIDGFAYCYPGYNAQDFFSTRHVAIGFGQRLLAVHHRRISALTQFVANLTKTLLHLIAMLFQDGAQLVPYGL